MGIPIDRVGQNGAAAGQGLPYATAGFDPDERVQARLLSAPIDLGQHTADPDGQVEITFTVPAQLAAGAHTISLAGLTSGFTVSIPLTVAVAGSTGSTPATRLARFADVRPPSVRLATIGRTESIPRGRTWQVGGGRAGPR